MIKLYLNQDIRSDSRGQRILNQRMRNYKKLFQCRGEINKLNAPFLAIYESLIPAEEEKAKQKQLLSFLENLVRKEWPDGRLYVYGSCANSFGVSKSDIDVCLTLVHKDLKKSEVLLKLADILQSDNLQNVQVNELTSFNYFFCCFFCSIKFGIFDLWVRQKLEPCIKIPGGSIFISI